ncbi:HAD-IIIC family phosphatase [Burkholderia arboris]|uniref:FkbH domain protein n=1 Tax=Burkholderia arboris TaxID=488730 RepID=A0A9Q9SKB9_9BURK|nr:HAD-IIIC family phosphatase [Burkholderia arboris]MCA8494673.1 HAD-IIIC family phosphatase [Burkholderia arboris]VWB84517.1 FkbH domain protein [Burkholderia arboris]
MTETTSPAAQPVDDWLHRVPNDLSTSRHGASRILVIGSCFSELLTPYAAFAFDGATVDYVPYNFAGQLPPSPPHPVEAYAFQLIVLPMRTVAPETMTARLNYQNPQRYVETFNESRQRLLQLLGGALSYNDSHQILTFVANFLVPQQNAMGRMLPRYDLRNPVFYTEKLNELIAGEVSARQNTYTIDIDAISSTIGKKYIQDDSIWVHAHGTFVFDFDYPLDSQRIEPPAQYSQQYEIKTNQFCAAVWHELRAMYTSAKQIDSVKLVIVDLDDTLWRGVIAEEGIRFNAIEGYPLGVIEALQFLKRRGILLAIASKNDEQRIRELWSTEGFVGGVISMSDFASIKINWKPKVENIQDILAETNLLPRNVVFIDDNPAERAAVAEAFPDMRVLGGDVYRLRRVLLWSGETQVAHVTDESGRRTEMIQAQIEREHARSKMSREAFLQSLQVKVTAHRVTNTNDARFTRAFELVNKSNQFNTTGRRWSFDECARAFDAGTVMVVAHVIDKYTDYGLVAVAIVHHERIEQYVMSCRVFGLGVEQSLLASITAAIHAHSDAVGDVVETPANALGRAVYSTCGFTEAVPGTWVLSRQQRLAAPRHVTFSVAGPTAV